MKQKIVLAIVGSTLLAGNEKAQAIIESVLDEFKPSQVVSGGADGIDTMAAETARARGIDVKEFKPLVKRWAGPGGFEERNQQIADACTHLIRIVSSLTTTYGSGWTRDRAKEQGKFTRNYIVVQEDDVNEKNRGGFQRYDRERRNPADNGRRKAVDRGTRRRD